MAIDPNIKKKADNIRTKIKGKEVRESLASGLEAMSSDVVDTVSRQGNVENQFQDVIENTTDKDVISAPEIIAARNGEANLKARLDQKVSKTEHSISVLDYGAKGDGTTDDTQAIRNAILACDEYVNEVELVFPKSSGYLTKDTINVPLGIDVIMDSPIIYDGPNGKTALNIGSETLHNFNRRFELTVIGNNDYNWVDYECVGIRIVNSYGSRIDIGKVGNFTRGILFEATNGRGFTMNNVTMTHVDNCKYSVHVSALTLGWPNANNYYGGFFGKSSSQNPNIEFYGIVIDSADRSYPGNNSNNFYGQQFEAGRFMLPLKVQGYANTFNNIRCENTSQEALMIVEGSRNRIYGAHIQSSSDEVISLGGDFNNYYIMDEVPVVDIDLFDDASESDGVVTLKKLSFSFLGDPFTKSSPKDLLTIDDSGAIETLKVYPAYGLGVGVDTTKAKEYRLMANVSGESRILVRCFDSEGNVLGSEDRPMVEGDMWEYPRYAKRGGGPFAFHENLNGYYQGSSMFDFFDGRIKVSPEVKKINVMIVPQPGTKISNYMLRTVGTGGRNHIPRVYYS